MTLGLQSSIRTFCCTGRRSNGCRRASLLQRSHPPWLLKLCRGGVLNGELVEPRADEALAAKEQAWSAWLNTAEGFPWIWIFLVGTVFVFFPGLLSWDLTRYCGSGYSLGKSDSPPGVKLSNTYFATFTFSKTIYTLDFLAIFWRKTYKNWPIDAIVYLHFCFAVISAYCVAVISALL